MCSICSSISQQGVVIGLTPQLHVLLFPSSAWEQELITNYQVIAMHQINIAEASKNLPELIEAAISGEEIVITKDDQPIVKLVPVPPVKKRRPAKAGSAKGLVTISDDFDEPLEDFKDYM